MKSPMGAFEIEPLTPASSIASFFADSLKLKPSTGHPLGTIHFLFLRVVNNNIFRQSFSYLKGIAATCNKALFFSNSV